MLGDKHLELDMNMRSLICNKYFTSYNCTCVSVKLHQNVREKEDNHELQNY